MQFWASVGSALAANLPVALAFALIAPIPYMIAEQVAPAGARPRWQSYALNFGIAISTLILSTPTGIAAGALASTLHETMGWGPLAIPFDQIAAVPIFGIALKGAALILVPLLLHDLWCYWSHRLEHRSRVLWAFHSLHHSDPEMNCTTWVRDHFLQAGWRCFFPVFTLGLIVQLDYAEAGLAALLSQVAFMMWSMFYHSAIRVELPWLDRVLVTLQVHRIHHTIDPAHHDRNFADPFPVFDMVFGTYLNPVPGEFAATGLGASNPAPRNAVSTQVMPAWNGLKHIARFS